MDLHSFFDRVLVINLDRRPDRWNSFKKNLPTDWPFRAPERFRAIDGRHVKPPDWWREGGGAWGCYRSHARVLEDCLQNGIGNVLVLEDDAVFCDHFSAEARTFLSNVPSDWEMLYLGGQHLDVGKVPPRRVNDWVYEPYNVNRTHAMAIKGPEFMQVLYRHLHQWNHWLRGNHIDHHLGRLHRERNRRIYAPKSWLIGQAAGQSDISWRNAKQRYWPPAEVVSKQIPSNDPFVAIIGLHSSGSSALAGLLYHLGLHLGNQLGGFYGKDPNSSCGFEAVGLVNICEDVIPFPSTNLRREDGGIVNRLRTWINHRGQEATNKGTLAAGKYPLLCRLGNQLLDAIGDRLKVIHINRPLDESIASLVRRCPRLDAERLATHQRWLWDGKLEFLAKLPYKRILTVEYSELLANPASVATKCATFLGIRPTDEQFARAITYVDPKRRHIGSRLQLV